MTKYRIPKIGVYTRWIIPRCKKCNTLIGLCMPKGLCDECFKKEKHKYKTAPIPFLDNLLKR